MTRDSNRSEDQILTRRSVQLFAVEIFGMCVILTVPINDCESPLEFLNSVRKMLWSARSLCVPECLLSVKNLVTLDQMTNKCQGSKHGQGFIWSLKHRRAEENFIPVRGKALIAVYIYLNTDIWKQVTVVKRSEHWIENCCLEKSVLRVKKESTEMAFGCKTPLKRMFFFFHYTQKYFTLLIRYRSLARTSGYIRSHINLIRCIITLRDPIVGWFNSIIPKNHALCDKSMKFGTLITKDSPKKWDIRPSQILAMAAIFQNGHHWLPFPCEFSFVCWYNMILII